MKIHTARNFSASSRPHSQEKPVIHLGPIRRAHSHLRGKRERVSPQHSSSKQQLQKISNYLRPKPISQLNRQLKIQNGNPIHFKKVENESVNVSRQQRQRSPITKLPRGANDPIIKNQRYEKNKHNQSVNNQSRKIKLFLTPRRSPLKINLQ